MKRIIFIVLLFVFTKSFGQKNHRFDTFVKLFPKVTLPTTIRYSESEFQTDYYTPEDTSVRKDSIPYADHILPKDSVLIINYELVKSFLLADTESVTPRCPDNSSISVIVYPKYYVSSQLITNTNFICLCYERQYYFNGNTNAEKFLCTITKTGKLIDKIMVASADYSGTGILAEGFRVPWFPDTKSDIKKDLSIAFKNGNFGDFIFQIDNNGKIKKIFDK